MRPKTDGWHYSLGATLLLFTPFDLLASLGMDMYLPVVPLMPVALSTTHSVVQMTLTLYLVLIGGGQLLFGPLSDRFGRRPILLIGGVIYGVSALGLALTSSIEVFLGVRLLQACGASACLVALFATVRDVYATRAESQIIYGLLGSMLAMVPAVGPLLGALIDVYFGWRAIFFSLGASMVLACLAAFFLWPETCSKSSTGFRFAHLVGPLRSKRFWLYSLCYSAGMGSFFVFFSVAPGLMMERQGLDQVQFSVLFASVAVSMMVSSRFLVGRLRYWERRKTLQLGMVCLMGGAILLAFGEIYMPQSPVGFIVPMWGIGIGISICMSVAPNGALAGFDHIAGSVTALYFCLGGVLLGGVGTVMLILLPLQTAWPVVGYCALMSIAVWVLSTRR
ncbi:CmlA/FloR family chloramphenicol efflux MFS transporter [Terasakiella pusilla]|uniref:CmlA/FloR family chloramphenicol efflux MFS transporter n=1 Tax=Terasakiella pusilla TaxID=64973 RepID=UPI00048BED7F